MNPEIRRVGPQAAADVLAVVTAAFAARPVLDPPADASSETVESIAALLTRGSGLVAYDAGQPVGAVIIDPVDTAVYLRRFGVIPGAQGRGLARALVSAGLAEAARRRDDAGDDSPAGRVVILAREELPLTANFWRDMGFVETDRRPPYIEMARPIPLTVEVSTAQEMQALGERLASYLRGGDVLVLSGELGAGKTTFTQGLGSGLGVRGSITSPTFVIARVHPSLSAGPALVHVDAYRLGGSAELDDLDLDNDLAEAVTVVEWGSGLAEGLADSWLDVRIERAAATTVIDPEADPRVVEIDPIGLRWLDVDLG